MDETVPMATCRRKLARARSLKTVIRFLTLLAVLISLPALADADPKNRATWFYRNPDPAELVNLLSPIQYYIRILRISWEIIKKLLEYSFLNSASF